MAQLARASSLLTATAIVLFATLALAQTTSDPLAPRQVPAKSIPVPGTISPAMQAIVAQPLRTNWDKPPTTPEGWTDLVKQLESIVSPQIAPMAGRMNVKIEPSTIDGVKVYVLTPESIPE
jgi:monoterpene epsilon-lactone hydrolase